MLGVGCDRGTSFETLHTALNQALTQASVSTSSVKAMATIDKKNDEACILSLSQMYQWPLIYFSAEALAQVEVPNPSETVRKYMGTPAVAEAAAILAAEASMHDLILEKYKYCGKDARNATISIVRMQNE